MATGPVKDSLPDDKMNDIREECRDFVDAKIKEAGGDPRLAAMIYAAAMVRELMERRGPLSIDRVQGTTEEIINSFFEQERRFEKKRDLQ